MNRALIGLAGFCLTLLQLPAAQAASPWRDGTPRTAIAELFGWNWNSVARECVNFLGPKGYRAVKVMPANEHISDSHWWARYQPVSYRLESYSGTRAEFAAMISACHSAGIDVEVDTIINHMANGSGVGSAGSGYGSDGLSYPGVPWGSNDFHPPCLMNGADIPSYTQCWLGRKAGDAGLPDLDTGSPYVQGKLGDHLRDLRALGIDRFYIDAAKHILLSELQTMLAGVPGPFAVAQEVWTDAVGPAPNWQRAYGQLGIVTELNYARVMRTSFKNLSGRNLAALNTFLSSPDRVSSATALVFVTNHDLERTTCTQTTPGGDCATLTVLQPEFYFPANVLMLAHPYGTPYVYSSYYFGSSGDGPPHPPYVGDETVPANCSAEYSYGRWNCSHRDWRVANMAGFRNYTEGTPLLDWQAEGSNRVSFRRGERGFAAFNNTASWWQKTFSTGLPDGLYCNVVASANPETGVCPATTQVHVNGGLASLSIGPWATAVLHVGARPSCTNPTDFSFPEIRDAAPGSLQLSALLTISGLGCSTPVSISGGEYSINGAAFTRAAGLISNGQTLQLRVTAPATAGATTTATVQVGSDSVVFRVSTASAERCGGAVSCTLPTSPQAGQPVTVLYRGILQSSSTLTLHWGINGWSQVQNTAMRRDSDGYWSVSIPLPLHSTELDYVLTNGSQWDNNGGRDWRIAVLPCSSNCGPVTVSFNVTAQTQWGENIHISGNSPELGNNSLNPALAPRCSPTNYPLWTCQIAFGNGGRAIEYRYAKLGLTPRSESSARQLTLPASGGIVINDGAFGP